jgi:hypothetical protein
VQTGKKIVVGDTVEFIGRSWSFLGTVISIDDGGLLEYDIMTVRPITPMPNMSDRAIYSRDLRQVSETHMKKT